MQKFGIEVTKGNTETVIETFETKEAAMDFGKDLFMRLQKGDGIVTCFEAEFDDQNRKVGTAERIYHVWY